MSFVIMNMFSVHQDRIVSVLLFMLHLKVAYQLYGCFKVYSGTLGVTNKTPLIVQL
jgi:hypothetical protein